MDDKYYLWDDDANMVCGGVIKYLDGFESRDDAINALNKLIEEGKLDKKCYVWTE